MKNERDEEGMIPRVMATSLVPETDLTCFTVLFGPSGVVAVEVGGAVELIERDEPPDDVVVGWVVGIFDEELREGVGEEGVMEREVEEREVEETSVPLIMRARLVANIF